MKTDVKLLIAALTTERNSIDRAIASLRAIVEPEAVAAPAKAAPKPKAKKRTRMHLSDDVKRQIIARMQAVGDERGAAWAESTRLQREFGLKTDHSALAWKSWQASFRRREQSAVTTPAVRPEPADDFAHAV